MEDNTAAHIIRSILWHKFPEVPFDESGDKEAIASFVCRLRLHQRRQYLLDSGFQPDVPVQLCEMQHFEGGMKFSLSQVDIQDTVSMLRAYCDAFKHQINYSERHECSDNIPATAICGMNLLTAAIKEHIDSPSDTYRIVSVCKSSSKELTTICGWGWTSFVPRSDAYDVEIYLTDTTVIRFPPVQHQHIQSPCICLSSSNVAFLITSSCKCLFSKIPKIGNIRLFQKICPWDTVRNSRNCRAMLHLGLLKSDICKSFSQ